MIYLVALFLGLWYWRRNHGDELIWQLATYLGVGGLLWFNYNAAAASGGVFSEALPRIVRDFLLLGMVGFVQSLAVNKRMPIWLAVVITLGIFALAHFLEFQPPGADRSADPGNRTQWLDPAAEQAMTEATLSATGEWLVQVDHGDQRLAAAARRLGWRIEPAFAPRAEDITELDDYYVVDVTDQQRSAALLRDFGFVRYFEPNEVVTVRLPETNRGPVPAPPALSINDPDAGQQWAMQQLDMNAYYAVLNGVKPQKTARIAILDTGVDAAHEDIAANYFTIDKRYDNDGMGHGTHCAGIAAGVTNNGIGIGSLAGGMDRFVDVTSVKVLGAGGMGTQKSIIAGIIEAADEGVDVISLSLGAISNGSRLKAYNQAVKYARDQGAIVVAAAGNSNRDARGYSPANSSGIIAVAAVDQGLKRAVFSNTVNNVKWGIAAPGVAIYSTTPGDTYKAYSGTSMACPFVAGLLATLRAIDPDLTAQQAYRVLHDTGTPGPDVATTGRIVNPAAAVRAVLDR